MKNIFLLLIVCLISFFLLSYRITDVPPGINGDEAAIGYNAALLSKTLRDESGKFLPLFIAPKTADWKQPVYVYTMAGLFKTFGTSFFWLRGTSTFFAVLSIVFLYFLCKRYYDTRFFIISWILFVTTPIVLLLSHWGAENISTVPFVIFWLWMLASFDKTKERKYLIFCGVSLGIALFTYFASRAVVPMLAILTFIYLQFFYKKDVRSLILSLIYFIIGIAPFVGILYFSKFFYPGALFGNYKPNSLSSVYDFLFRYLSTFDLSFLFFKGDSTNYLSTGIFGMLLLTSFPLFILGVFKIVQEKTLFPKLILVSFFLAPLLFGFVPDIYRASRLSTLVPFYIIISTTGIIQILSLKNIWLKNISLGLLFVLFVINYYSFSNDFWFYYPNRIAKDFSPPVSILRSQLKNGVDYNYKYYSSVQFLLETNDQK